MSKAPPLEPLFKELDNFIAASEFESAIASCDKILKVSPNDFDALQCKVVALIQLSKFDDALKLVDNNSELAKELIFERSYCLYRTKQFQEALSLLKGHPSPKPARVLELEAQVYYRLEDFQKCIQVYDELQDKHKLSSAELKTNLAAAFVSSELVQMGQKLVSSNKTSLSETFEFAYNAACLEIESGNYSVAEKHLQLAEKLCRDGLKEEGLSEQEMQDELSIITAQKAFVLQMQGKHNEALELYNVVLKSKPSDESVAAVVHNNIVAINKEHDLFDSHKKIEKAASLEQKLASNQRKVIGYNHCLVLLHMNKADQCRELLKTLQKNYPESDRLALVSAALLMKEKKVTDSEELLKTFAQQHKDSSDRVQISLAQVHLSRGNIPGAISTLENVGQLRTKPDIVTKEGIVATLVALYEQVNDIDKAIKVWDDYCSILESQKDKDEEKYIAILKQNASFKLKNKKFKEAAQTYEKIIKINATDLEALPGLIIAYSQVDPKLAEKYDVKLPPLQGESQIDAEALENLAAPRIGKTEVQTKPKEEEAKQELAKEKKKKKKKKKKLPKNIDPNKLPDPERWIPLKQRSYYKKRRRGGKLEKGPQGSSVLVDKKLDRSATGKQEQSPTVNQKEQKPVQPPQKPASQPNKKKKGRK